ncbi:MAG: phosphoserine phosphatase SerB, partial [Candidatus Altarchaeaceae archaeon]
DAMEGKIDFKEALKRRVSLLKGMDVKILEDMAKDIKLNPDAEELIYRLKELGYKIAIISGGFKIFTDKLKEKYPIDYAYANELEVENGKLTGRIKGEIIDAKGKEKIMIEISKKENISLSDIIAIGDGANDRFMIKSAGLGIAFNSKEILKKFSSGILKRENIAGIIYSLGDIKEL